MPYKWQWLKNPWFRRPYIVLIAPLVLVICFLGAVDEAFTYLREQW